MQTLDAIFSRKSIRNFTDKPVSPEDIKTILKAGMSGPTCVNARQWSFIVVENKETLAKMAQANGRPAQPLLGAALGILVCGDLSRAFEPAPDYWVVDGAIAAQNMTLAAHELGIGSVWLGTWPQMDRVQNQRELFALPQEIVPHSILAFGYPDLSAPAREKAPKPEFEEDRVHFEKW